MRRELQRLERSAKYCFLKGLERGIFPCVMARLPDSVMFRKNGCLRVGISEYKIDYTIGRAWNKAYKDYSSSWKLDY